MKDAPSSLERCAEPVDLVITNYHMPEMEGISLFQSMQQDLVLAEIPVLLISGIPTEKFVTQALAVQ